MLLKSIMGAIGIYIIFLYFSFRWWLLKTLNRVDQFFGGSDDVVSKMHQVKWVLVLAERCKGGLREAYQL